MAPLQTRYTDQPIYFSTGLRSAVAVIKFNFLYRPLFFRPPILKPLDRSQIWVGGVDLFSPPVGSRKSLGLNLYGRIKMTSGYHRNLRLRKNFATASAAGPYGTRTVRVFGD
jgi:hypothetical protein